MSYSYSPKHTTVTRVPRPWSVGVQPTPKKPAAFLWLALGCLFVLSSFLLKGIGSAVYYAQTRNLPSESTYIDGVYAQTVATKNNPDQTARAGADLLDKKYPKYAAMQFARASELDPNFRDAAYGYAYALLQSKKDTMSPEDFKKVYEAINAAEKIDPLYKPLLSLKLLVAKMDNNTDLIASTSARLNLLNQ